MSKLFEALQKIEQQQTQEPDFSSGKIILKKKRSARPFATIFLILIVLLATGGITLYYLNHHTKRLFLTKPVLHHREKETRPPANPLKNKKKNPVIKVRGNIDLPALQKSTKIRKNPLVFAGISLPTKTVSASPELTPVPQQQSAIPSPETPGTFPENSGPDIRYQKKTAELKRTVQQLLYQAEERRKEGDMKGAVTLYGRAWKIKKSAATANNLAAGLIALKQFKKARTLLQEALEMAPDDEDLQYNLKITEKKLQP
jgi:tetratricopeptide (TPR) repeat protein